ncbi:hypothetical protein CI109_103356 [Kwoniella shandongensis]|uniref:Uncharacterized protein n=1 Tax=Kwoniella shandongensis TaxID=1734106 RepID=A0A5M6C0L4_9TREE|nr:uncharacterized protein CI109_004437 [Kwoniella shandongensis]KAA5527145.1 hypothetical protein CI109_004437 [Kwoniella shandongensis]
MPMPFYRVRQDLEDPIASSSKVTLDHCHEDRDWDPISLVRPREVPIQKWRLRDIILPRPSLRQTRAILLEGTHTPSVRRKMSLTNRSPVYPLPGSGSGVESGAETVIIEAKKERKIRRKGSVQNFLTRVGSRVTGTGKESCLNPDPSSGSKSKIKRRRRGSHESEDDDDDSLLSQEWEMITPPLTTASSSTPSPNPSASAEGSGSDELQIQLSTHPFPSPPIRRPLSYEMERQRERALPRDHPFHPGNVSPPLASPSEQISPNHIRPSFGTRPPIQSAFETNLPAQRTTTTAADDDNRIQHLSALLDSLKALRSTLYAHNSAALLILETEGKVLPPSVKADLERRLDEWWVSWGSVLNAAGRRVGRSLNQAQARERVRDSPRSSFDVPPPLHREWDQPPRGQAGETSVAHPRRSKSRTKSKIATHPTPAPMPDLIPPPLTSDTIERLIWYLEERGQVASGTFTRMFGSRARVRKMSEEEVKEADEKGLRTWQTGEWGRIERESWRMGRVSA